MKEHVEADCNLYGLERYFTCWKNEKWTIGEFDQVCMVASNQWNLFKTSWFSSKEMTFDCLVYYSLASWAPNKTDSSLILEHAKFVLLHFSVLFYSDSNHASSVSANSIVYYKTNDFSKLLKNKKRWYFLIAFQIAEHTFSSWKYAQQITFPIA